MIQNGFECLEARRLGMSFLLVIFAFGLNAEYMKHTARDLPCIPTHRLQPTVLSDLRLVKMAREDGDMKADGH